MRKQSKGRHKIMSALITLVYGAVFMRGALEGSLNLSGS